MTIRATGSGNLTFGMVSIPVKLHPVAEARAAITYDLLHKKCGTRVKRQYVCPKDHQVLGPEDLEKGYELRKGEYVTFSDDELAAVAQETDRSIEIGEFVPEDSVDPLYFAGAWFLSPDKGGARAYRLLMQALRDTKRLAIARWSVRGKQHLVLVRPGARVLVMQQLHYADEVRAEADVPVAQADAPRREELALAVSLVKQISSASFAPGSYSDASKDRTLAAIRQKAKGKTIVTAPERPKAKVVDLMEALKASLASKKPVVSRAKRPTPAVGHRRAS
jgi:DNA end-binding protein Ku